MRKEALKREIMRWKKDSIQNSFEQADWAPLTNTHSELTTVNIYTKSQRECSNKYTFDASLFVWRALALCRALTSDGSWERVGFCLLCEHKSGTVAKLLFVGCFQLCRICLVDLRSSFDGAAMQTERERLWTLLKKWMERGWTQGKG